MTSLTTYKSPTPSPSKPESLASSSALILWYCVVVSCLIVCILWARYYRIRQQRRRQEAVLDLARNISARVAERGRRANNVSNDNHFMAVILGESNRSSPDNMELIERALFGPDEADDIFSTARSALALSSAAATIAGISSRSRPWNQDRRRGNNIDSIEASVLVAHQILDRLEADHRRRKKEKYITLVRALGCTSMIVQECHLIHDDDDDTKDIIPRADDNFKICPEERMISDLSDGNYTGGQVDDWEGPGATSELKEWTIGASPLPTIPISPPALLTTNDRTTNLVVDGNHSSVHDDDENKHTILCIPLGPPGSPQHATTTSAITSATKSTTHRTVPSICAICLLQYKRGNHVSWSSNEECIHVFHRDCILLWLLKMNGSGGATAATSGGIVGGGNRNERWYLCPCCRREFVSESMLGNMDDATTTIVENET